MSWLLRGFLWEAGKRLFRWAFGVVGTALTGDPHYRRRLGR